MIWTVPIDSDSFLVLAGDRSADVTPSIERARQKKGHGHDGGASGTRTAHFLSIRRPSGGFFFDWQSTLDQELLVRAFDIIKPGLRDRMYSASTISEHIQFLRWVVSAGAVQAEKRSNSAAGRRELTNSAKVLRRAASILRSHLPRKHPLHSPFGWRPASSKQLTSDEARLLARLREQNAAIIFLESRASEYEDLARERAASGKIPDLLKKHCAICAGKTLCCLNRRPTLTADGPFYLLAALYYEAAVGAPDGNLERACRAEFPKIRNSVEFAKICEFNDGP